MDSREEDDKENDGNERIEREYIEATAHLYVPPPSPDDECSGFGDILSAPVSIPVKYYIPPEVSIPVKYYIPPEVQRLAEQEHAAAKKSASGPLQAPVSVFNPNDHAPTLPPDAKVLAVEVVGFIRDGPVGDNRVTRVVTWAEDADGQCRSMLFPRENINLHPLVYQEMLQLIMWKENGQPHSAWRRYQPPTKEELAAALEAVEKDDRKETETQTRPQQE